MVPLLALIASLVVDITLGRILRIPLENTRNVSTSDVIPILKGAGGSSMRHCPPAVVVLERDGGHGGGCYGHVTVGISPSDCAFCVPTDQSQTQTFKLSFDTGSSDLFVFGTAARRSIPFESHPEAFKHTYYSCTDSGSSKDQHTDATSGSKVSISIAQGYTYNGHMVTDNVQIGSNVLNAIGITVIDSIDVPEHLKQRQIPYDGFLGLGFQELSELGQVPPFIRMINEGIVDEPVVSFYFNSNNEKGEVILGGIDKTRYDRRTGLHFVPLTLPDDKIPRWMIPFEGIQVGSGRRIYNQNMDLLVDTGLSELFTITADLMSAIARKSGALYSGEGDVILDCSKRESLEDLTFLIRGRKYSFSGEEYFVHYPPAVIAANPLRYTDRCYLAAYTVGGEFTQHVTVGEFFMKKYYTVFDYGKHGPKSRRIGFGVAKHDEDMKNGDRQQSSY